MKKCPYCRATIEESSRFCIYCMSSLEPKTAVQPRVKKHTRWIVIAMAAAILLTVSAVLSAISRTSPSDTDKTADTTTAAPVQTTTMPTSLTTTVAATTVADTTATAVTTTTAPPQTDIYTYRETVREDVYINLTIALPDDTVVITGVREQAADGIYRVPNVIDGKRVVAIAAEAFAGVDAKIVVLPENVMTINRHAFADCPHLTDIYFTSEAIYTHAEAFAPLSQRTDTLTIHCAWDCSNRHFSYYRNIAAEWFDADYQEWNGGEIE